MYYIANDSHDPTYNLALEEYVLKNLRLDDSIVLLWQNEPSVIIGRFQNTLEEINQAYVQERGIHVVRRITGGGAVYHDLGNLNFSFIVPSKQKEIDFHRFTEPVVKALAKMGIHAQHSGRNDITIDGKKFSGNAQYQFHDRTLHHGTLLFNAQLEEVQKALQVKPDKIQSKGVKSVRSRVTNISEYLPEKRTLEQFRQLLLTDLFQGQAIQTYPLTIEDQEHIQALRREKYLTWDWNIGRSPDFDLVKSARYPWGGLEFRLKIHQGQIENCTIYGDFFSNADIEELAKAFIGIRYRREDLEAKIQQIDLTRYLPNLTREELLQLIL